MPESAPLERHQQGTSGASQADRDPAPVGERVAEIPAGADLEMMVASFWRDAVEIAQLMPHMPEEQKQWVMDAVSQINSE